MKLRREVALFAAGGVLGFLVDGGIVQTLVSVAHWNPYLARVISFLAAASVTWLWNRHYTFAHRRRHTAAREWGQWLVVMAAGAGVNYGVYALCLVLSAAVRAWPVIGVAAGSAVAAAGNFAGARMLVFTGVKTTS